MRIIAFDLGEKKIGAAICDPLGIIVRPLSVVIRQDDSQTTAELLTLARNNYAEKIVLGLPLSFDGQESQGSQSIRLFGQALSAHTHLPIEYFDESGSTKEAKEIIRQTKRKRQRLTMEDDAIAACVILQHYLARQ